MISNKSIHFQECIKATTRNRFFCRRKLNLIGRRDTTIDVAAIPFYLHSYYVFYTYRLYLTQRRCTVRNEVDDNVIVYYITRTYILIGIAKRAP